VFATISVAGVTLGAVEVVAGFVPAVLGLPFVLLLPLPPQPAIAIAPTAISSADRLPSVRTRHEVITSNPLIDRVEG
jgi:hypothetical protein